MANLNLQQLITDSPLSEDLKVRMLSVTPKIEKNFSEYLSKVFSRQDISLGSEELAYDIEVLVNISYLLNQGSPEGRALFFQELNNYSKLLDDSDRQLFLNFLLDIRPNFSKYKFSSTELQAIIDFESQNFWFLTKKEIIYLLENHAFYLNGQMDLLQELKTAVYQNSWEFDSAFATSAFNALLANKEPVGEGSSQVLGLWIKDFVNFNPKSFQTGDIMSIGVYFTKNPNVRSLDEADRKNLSEIFKICIWLQDFTIDENAVLIYMQEQNSLKVKRLVALLRGELEENQPTESAEEVNQSKNITPELSHAGEESKPSQESKLTQESAPSVDKTPTIQSQTPKESVVPVQSAGKTQELASSLQIPVIPIPKLSSENIAPAAPIVLPVSEKPASQPGVSAPDSLLIQQSLQEKPKTSALEQSSPVKTSQEEVVQEKITPTLELPKKNNQNKPEEDLVLNRPSSNITLKPLPKIHGSVNIQELLQRQKQNMTSIKTGVQNKPLAVESQSSAPVKPQGDSTPERPEINIDAKLEDLKKRTKVDG